MSETQSDDVLVFQNVTKSFGAFTAVNAINLNIHRGEVFGFLGPNGAGKSTTIRLLLDVLRPTSGQVTLFGESSSATQSTHRRLGYLSGDMVIDTNLTGKQYLEFLANVYHKNCQAKMGELAEMLQANLAVKIGNYSRGNKQKIGLIGALMHEPELLVLDEPTSGFDPLVQETFTMLIGEFNDRGGTVFMSSHILSEVQELCGRLAFIKDGKIITTTTTQKLTADAAKRVKIKASHAVIRAIHVKHPHGLQFQTHDSEELNCTYQGNIHQLLVYLALHKVDDVTIREPELEEIFMHYYLNTKGDNQGADVNENARVAG